MVTSTEAETTTGRCEKVGEATAVFFTKQNDRLYCALAGKGIKDEFPVESPGTDERPNFSHISGLRSYSSFSNSVHTSLEALMCCQHAKAGDVVILPLYSNKTKCTRHCNTVVPVPVPVA